MRVKKLFGVLVAAAVPIGFIACGSSSNGDTPAGGYCDRDEECSGALVCADHACTSDTSLLDGGTNAVFDSGAMDAPATDGEVAPTDAPPPQDTGTAVDTGTAPDTGTPQDTGTTPTDTGTPPQDTGTTPKDTGTTPTDTGTPPQDTGTAPTDSGPDDTGSTPADTGAGD